MKSKLLIALFCLLAFLTGEMIAQSGNLATSLHGTRAGKNYFYGTANGGFENLTNIPIDSLGCVECHGATDALGNAYDETYDPKTHCNDCHDAAFQVAEQQCIGCHGRQAKMIQMGITDVHRDADMVCWDCHSTQDIHGDGNSYNSMLEKGAIDVECTDCHNEQGRALPADHDEYDPHSGKIHCASCHSSTVISCYSCHFESQLEHNKRAYKPLSGFVMLGNRDKDSTVYPMSFQSLTYNDTTFYAMAPFTPHSVTAEGRDCDDCHAAENVMEYVNTGEMLFADWHEEDSTLTWMKGIVPIPEDYATTLKMEFVEYLGSPTDPVAASKNWGSLGKMLPDEQHMLFGTPLSQSQMQMLQFDFGRIDSTFKTSLHYTRAGKDYWYITANNGFEQIMQVSMDSLGCKECHGPTDASGEAYTADYEPGCIDCHDPNVEDGPGVSEAQCLGCHGRQTKETAMGLTDVHTSGDDPMKCWDCHKDHAAGEGEEVYPEFHGDGHAYNNIFESPSVQCSECHSDQTSNHPSGMPGHSADIECTACHSETVISCYNCHIESQIDAHLKRPLTAIKDFMMLVNYPNGKVGPATFQSATYQGNSMVAFGPFTPHTTMDGDDARICSDCHANFGGTLDAVTQYNTTGEIQFSTWDEDSTKLSHIKGIVPMPVDFEHSFKMASVTYTGSTSDPIAPSTNWTLVKAKELDLPQMLVATPLDKKQMKALGFDTTMVSVEIEKDETMPESFELAQNYPNPFNPVTTIQYSITEATQVTLVVYDAIGNQIEVLVNRDQKPGTYKVRFNASNLASGVYFYRIITNQFEQTKKLILMK